MRIATGPKAERAVQKVLLIDRLEQHHNGPLRHLVFERRDAERTLAAIRLVYVVTPDWRRSITTRFQSIHQPFAGSAPNWPHTLRRLTIDSHRTVLARALIRVPHPFGIEIMVQRRERHRWVFCSPAWLSAPVSLTRFQVSKHPPCFSKAILYNDAPLPSIGSA
jgi:hypothetical protein